MNRYLVYWDEMMLKDTGQANAVIHALNRMGSY